VALPQPQVVGGSREAHMEEDDDERALT
jgi:hypothetical protein